MFCWITYQYLNIIVLSLSFRVILQKNSYKSCNWMLFTFKIAQDSIPFGYFLDRNHIWSKVDFSLGWKRASVSRSSNLKQHLAYLMRYLTFLDFSWKKFCLFRPWICMFVLNLTGLNSFSSSTLTWNTHNCRWSDPIFFMKTIEYACCWNFFQRLIWIFFLFWANCNHFRKLRQSWRN